MSVQVYLGVKPYVHTMLLPYLLALLIVLAIVMVRRRSEKLTSLHKQISVSFPDIPIIGHAYKFLGNNEDSMVLFDEFARQGYRNKYGAVSFWFANFLCVSVCDPVCASVVLKTCLDKWPITLFIRHLIGNGSVFGEEDIWRLRRKILAPMFASRYYNNFVKIFERNNKILLKKLATVVGKGDFSMWDYFSSYALDSALDMTFGENVNAQKHRNHPFVEAFVDYSKNGAARVRQLWMYSTALYRLLPVGDKQRYNRRVMWNFVEKLIIKKKKEMSEGQLENKTNHDHTDTYKSQCKSFLEMLIEFSGGDDGYSNIELREEALVLVLAATDTSSSGACFATVLLANYPEVQDKVYKEIKEVFGDSMRSISHDDLPKLKYLDAVMKESLRLYPPVAVTLRKCNQDTELPSGLILPRGCSVLMNIWGVHRNPHYWGPDADEFNPDRFLNATPEQLSMFMPFVNGPRNCTGNRLALASMKLSLAEITRRYRIVPATSYHYDKRKPLRVSFEIMLKHVDNFIIQLENRC